MEVLESVLTRLGLTLDEPDGFAHCNDEDIELLAKCVKAVPRRAFLEAVSGPRRKLRDALARDLALANA